MDALYAGPLFSVADRVAVVTGGGSGLGLMQAVALASNGATVFITGRRRGKLEAAVTHYSQLDAVKSAGGSLVALQMDVDDQDSILKGVATIRESHDAISVLVNNAGVINGKTWDTSDLDVDALSRKWLGIGADAWEKTFRTNGASRDEDLAHIAVTSAFNVSAAMLPLLAAGVAKFGPESSSIINIGSISGVMRNTQLGQVRSRGSRRALILSFCYNTSKSALQQLTRMLATELLRPSLRIRVNEVQPGYFPSALRLSASC